MHFQTIRERRYHLVGAIAWHSGDISDIKISVLLHVGELCMWASLSLGALQYPHQMCALHNTTGLSCVPRTIPMDCSAPVLHDTTGLHRVPCTEALHCTAKPTLLCTAPYYQIVLCAPNNTTALHCTTPVHYTAQRRCVVLRNTTASHCTTPPPYSVLHAQHHPFVLHRCRSDCIRCSSNRWIRRGSQASEFRFLCGRASPGHSTSAHSPRRCVCQCFLK